MTNLEADEQAFVSAAKLGDSSAFTRLIKAHDPALRKFVFSMLRGSLDVDDVLQETYLKAYRSLGGFNQDSSFKTWLHSIAYRSVLDFIRKTSRVQLETDSELHLVADSQSSVADRASAAIDVRAALSGLTEKQRAAVLLVDGHGFEYAAVAEILGVPTGTVGFQVHRARKSLRNQLAASQKESR